MAAVAETRNAQLHATAIQIVAEIHAAAESTPRTERWTVGGGFLNTVYRGSRYLEKHVPLVVAEQLVRIRPEVKLQLQDPANKSLLTRVWMHALEDHGHEPSTLLLLAVTTGFQKIP